MIYRTWTHLLCLGLLAAGLCPATTVASTSNHVQSTLVIQVDDRELAAQSVIEGAEAAGGYFSSPQGVEGIDQGAVYEMSLVQEQ